MRLSRRIATELGARAVHPPRLIVVIGKPGAGKTRFALATTASLALSSRPIPVWLYAPGADRRSLIRRLVKQWRPSGLPTIRSRVARLRAAPVFAETRPRLGSVEMWLAARRVDRALQRRGTRLGLIIVDDLSQMGSRSYDRKLENLTHIARDLERFVIALARPHPSLMRSLERQRVRYVVIERDA